MINIEINYWFPYYLQFYKIEDLIYFYLIIKKIRISIFYLFFEKNISISGKNYI
jgi:hypothetical protein